MNVVHEIRSERFFTNYDINERLCWTFINEVPLHIDYCFLQLSNFKAVSEITTVTIIRL